MNRFRNPLSRKPWITGLLVAFSCATATAGGSKGGGGGGTRRSTPDQVMKAIRDAAPRRVQSAFKDLWSTYDPGLYGTRPMPTEIKSILPRMMVDEGQRLTEDIMRSPIRIRERGSCAPLGSKEKKGAYTELKRNSAICISVSELTRIPPESLSREIVALLAHEYAHHFGFGEEDATRLQEFFLTEEGRSATEMHTSLNDYHSALAWLDATARRLADALEKGKGTDVAACMQLGALHVRAMSVMSAAERGDLERERTKSGFDFFGPTNEIYRLVVRTCVLGNYCAEKDEPLELCRPQDSISSIRKGDREALIRELRAVETSARAIGKRSGAPFVDFKAAD